MKKAFALIFLFSSISAHAGTSRITYYVGESIVTNSSNSTITRNPYIDERTEDRSAGTIVEYVVSKQGMGFAENTSTMKITGNSFDMTESTGTVTGQGTLTGTSWDWTFLSAEFHMKTSAYSMRIIDYNFFAEPGSILGHKDFYLTLNSTPGERLVQQEDVILHVMDQATFAAKRKELLGH